MRGKVVCVLLALICLGITPAYAGKSDQRCRCSRTCQDHPRLCGEKAFFVGFLRELIGSPPPMRGKGDTETAHCDTPRITPAYAGKSKGIGGYNALQ